MILMARDILRLDTISKGNDKPWDKIITYMEENCTGDELYEFDFKGIEVIQPCNSTSFMKLLSNKKFGMVFHNNEATVKSIELACMINGFDSGRVRNVIDVVPKTLTPEEKRTDMIANQVLEYFTADASGNYDSVLEAYRRFDQIGQNDTVRYIFEAIRRHCANTGDKHILVNMKNASIQPHVIEYISNGVLDMLAEGITVVVYSEDKAVQDNLDMGLNVRKNNYSDSEKINLMRKRLTIGRVGILIKYKDGKGKDTFGRHGHGEVHITRVAIFRGFGVKDGVAVAKFRSFNNSTLYTKTHWYLEHDCETLQRLMYDDINIPVEDLGIYNDFLGSKYHFSSAVQYKHNGTMTMYSTTESGSVVGVQMTIPERAKAVFDDFGIDYDRESLEGYIEETRRILDTAD